MKKSHVINFIVPVLLVITYLLFTKYASDQIFFNTVGWIIAAAGAYFLTKSKFFKGGMLILIGIILVYQF